MKTSCADCADCSCGDADTVHALDLAIAEMRKHLEASNSRAEVLADLLNRHESFFKKLREFNRGLVADASVLQQMYTDLDALYGPSLDRSPDAN